MVKPVSGCYHTFDYKVQHKEVHASMSNAPDTSQAKIHCKKKICFFSFYAASFEATTHCKEKTSKYMATFANIIQKPVQKKKVGRFYKFANRASIFETYSEVLYANSTFFCVIFTGFR